MHSKSEYQAVSAGMRSEAMNSAQTALVDSIDAAIAATFSAPSHIAPGTWIQLWGKIIDVLPNPRFVWAANPNECGSVNGITATWCGKPYAEKLKSFLVAAQGGGKTYAGNETYRNNIKTGICTRETNFSPLQTVPDNGQYWPVTGPAARHGYAGGIYLPDFGTLGRLYMVGGNLATIDQARDGHWWYLDLDELYALPFDRRLEAWHDTGVGRPTGVPGGDQPSVVFYPRTRKIKVSLGPNGYSWYDPYNNVASVGRSWDVLPSSPVRAVIVGDYSYELTTTRKIVRYPLNPAGTFQVLTLTGDFAFAAGCGMLHDAKVGTTEMGSLVLCDGGDTLWFVDLASWVCTKLTGTLPSPVVATGNTSYSTYTGFDIDHDLDCYVLHPPYIDKGPRLFFPRGSDSYEVPPNPDTGSGGGGTTPPPAGTPSVGTFFASPSTLSAPGNVVLSASGITNADVVEYEGIAEALIGGSWTKTVSVTASRSFTLTARRSSDGASASKSCSVSVSAVTPSPMPVDPPTPGNLVIRLLTTPLGKITNTPQNGKLVAAGNPLGFAKHIWFCRLKDATGRYRWYKVFGDHGCIERPIVGTMGNGGGQQSIFSVDFATNDWRFEFPYYDLDPTHVQCQLPDDGFAIERKGFAYVWNGATNSSFTNHPAGIAAQVWGRLMRWSPTTGWQDVAKHVGDTLSNRAWGGAWDAVRDVFIIPARGGWVVIDGETGLDRSKRTAAGVIYQQYGTSRFNVASVAIDPIERMAYTYDHTMCQIWRTDVDRIVDLNPKSTLVATVDDAKQSGEGVAKMVFDEDERIVVIGTSKKMHLLQVDQNKLTSRDRVDGVKNAAGTLIAPSWLGYEPDKKKVISVGTMDWATNTPSREWYEMDYEEAT